MWSIGGTNKKIAQESRQRAKILTHAHQVELSAERSAIIKAEIHYNKSYPMSVLEAQVSGNKNCKDRYRKLMEEDGLDETDFSNVSHEVLEKIKGDELKIFILARKQDVPKSKLPKKRKLDDSIKFEKNLIYLAFECRNMKCIADEKLREAIAEELDNEEDDLILFSLKIHSEGDNETVKASTLLGNKDRINRVWQVFGLSSQLHDMQEIDDDTKIKIDYLQSLLLSRLACHIRRRINDK